MASEPRGGAPGLGSLSAPSRTSLAAALGRLDLRLLLLLRTRGHSPPVEAAAGSLSRMGEHGALWLVLAAVGAVLGGRRRRRHCRRALLTIALTYVVNTVVKVLIRRARPLLDDLPRLSPTLSDRSYPSAHASTSFAAARALSPALPSDPLYVAATAMALSRPYLGVHYPSDILAGAVLGTALAELTASG